LVYKTHCYSGVLRHLCLAPPLSLTLSGLADTRNVTHGGGCEDCCRQDVTPCSLVDSCWPEDGTKPRCLAAK